MKKKFKKLQAKRDLRRKEKEQAKAIPSSVPNITNTSIAQHRDEVLGSARKLIYPLQHSKHKIVLVSTSVFVISLIVFFTYTTLSLYRFQQNNIFLYRVTQVVPFPIARVGSEFVAYENYLFELRRYVHFYVRQQRLDFENNQLDRTQLEAFRQQALDRIISFVYVKRLADTNNVDVSDAEVDYNVELLRSQNRLGSNEEQLDDVLQKFYGWNRGDFERYLYQDLLAQKVTEALDPDTTARANKAKAELDSGADFADVAKKYTDDVTTKENGGEFGFKIKQDARDITPKAAEALFGLKKGEISKVINTGYSLEIFMIIDKKDNTVEAAHIQFNFKDISGPLNDLKEESPAREYVTFN
ncbi:MAG: peptidylprolyl isomerase [bacterium]|nr:peptidylprolyl isomerase [bacterium]